VLLPCISRSCYMWMKHFLMPIPRISAIMVLCYTCWQKVDDEENIIWHFPTPLLRLSRPISQALKRYKCTFSSSSGLCLPKTVPSALRSFFLCGVERWKFKLRFLDFGGGFVREGGEVEMYSTLFAAFFQPSPAPFPRS
jgi:hypothetical protein